MKSISIDKNDEFQYPDDVFGPDEVLSIFTKRRSNPASASPLLGIPCQVHDTSEDEWLEEMDQIDKSLDLKFLIRQ